MPKINAKTGTDTPATTSADAITGTVAGNKFSLDVNVTNASDFPSGDAGSGGLTDIQLRASAVPVSGPLTDAQLRAAAVPVTGTFYPATQPVSVASMPSTPVTGIFWQTTQPVSGPLTDTQLRAAAVPVSGAFWQGTQPVSIAIMPSTPVTGTFWQATQPVSGTVTANTTLAAETTKVIGTVNIAASQAVTANAGTNLNTSLLALDSTVAKDASLTTLNTSINTLLKPASTLAALTSITNTVTTSLGNSAGKANVLQAGTLVTTATTADQVIKTYTVTSGKTFYLEYFDVSCRLTTFAATATFFGLFSLESPAGTKLYTQTAAGTGVVPAPIGITLSEPIPIAAGTVIRIVCTPSAVTSFTWAANFGGYEK